VSFTARYSGLCNNSDCSYGDRRINEGDEVDYFEDFLMHVECVKHAQREDSPYCVKCWQYHRGECA
jgi:hypothetical protein